MQALVKSGERLAPWREDLLPMMDVFVGITQRILQIRKAEKEMQPKALEEAAEQTMTMLKALCEQHRGVFFIVPGGWVSNTSGAYGVVHMLVSPPSSDTFSFVTCNPRASAFHPSKPSDKSAKLLYKSALRLDGIPGEKVFSKAFWMTLFSQSVAPSEFHREEVLYDVLLPSLAVSGQLAPAAAACMKEPSNDWRTPMRSTSSSFWKSLVEALRYALRSKGASMQEAKRFCLALRVEVLLIASQHLHKTQVGSLPRDKYKLLQHACGTLANAALKAVSVKAITEEEAVRIESLVSEVRETAAGRLVAHENTPLHAFSEAASKAASKAQTFQSIYVKREDDDSLAGLVVSAGSASRPSMMEAAPALARTVEEAVAALVVCDNAVATLMTRSNPTGMASSSYTSRVASDRLAIARVRACLARRVSMPLPVSNIANPLIGTESCVWSVFPSRDLQYTCLSSIHRLLVSYGEAWQSVEDASRALETERCVVALALLCLFDRAIRVQEQGLGLSMLLAEDGGTCMSTSLCVANLPLLRVAVTMEISDADIAALRASSLAYITSLESICARKDLFVLRMPTDRIEMKKYSTTVMMLRRVMEHFGYPLFEGEDEDAPPEMEALMQWFTSPSSRLARDHPEWAMLRDVALIVKYLATMEPRQCELMRQRVPVSEFQSWALTFADGEERGVTASSGLLRGRRRGRGMAMSMGMSAVAWEVMGYRGQEMDMADIEVSLFGGRKVFFGEGPVVHSPADVSAILNLPQKEAPTEDDVLHCEDLPSFDRTLSHHEAETLIGYLTVPYIRIPLVLEFFAAGDRVTYLVCLYDANQV